MKNWFEFWFDTPYYHILYKDRDENEAKKFVSSLISKLNIRKDSRMLDLACGKGRHSIYLNSLGYDMTGVDLSFKSIEHAKKSENSRLHFFSHDMREPMPGFHFDVVLNLFTSFGYFENPKDNIEMLNSIQSYLNSEGILIIDFMNVNKIAKELVKTEEKVIDGVHFIINRKIEDGYIIKQIDFNDQGKEFSYIEKVQVLRLEDFKSLFEQTNFRIKKVSGNYNLDPFDENKSERLILCAEIDS